ncbi:MAG: glycosyltransferase family 2 protein [Candidatus Roizmanbacteria bacterium]
MSAHFLSFNMVSYNTKDLTLQALYSLDRSVRNAWISHTPVDDIELVLVDNASSDGTVSAIQKITHELCYTVKIISLTENIGFGRGHNRAAKESSGEYLLLLNTDTIALKDAVSKLFTQYLLRNPPNTFKTRLAYVNDGTSMHFLGPKLLNDDLSPQSSCGPYYNLLVIFAAIFLKGDYWGLTRSSPKILKQVDWVSGAAIMCKKEYFDQLSGFDEGIFMYMEEIELLHRASSKHMSTWFYPSAEWVHIGSASSNKTYPIVQVFRGFTYLYRKHHSKLEQALVQYILMSKAYLAIALGTLIRNQRIVETYRQALAVVIKQ